MGRLVRTLRESDGQALAELALVIPVLLLLVLGIVEFGKALNYWNDNNHLADVAARYAAVGQLPAGGTCGTAKGMDTLEKYIKCEAEADGAIAPKTICVSIPDATVGEPVEVKLLTEYQWLSFLKLAKSTLVGKATMRLEAVPPSGFATTTSTCT